MGGGGLDVMFQWFGPRMFFIGGSVRGGGESVGRNTSGAVLFQRRDNKYYIT